MKRFFRLAHFYFLSADMNQVTLVREQHSVWFRDKNVTTGNMQCDAYIVKLTLGIWLKHENITAFSSVVINGDAVRGTRWCWERTGGGGDSQWGTTISSKS